MSERTKTLLRYVWERMGRYGGADRRKLRALLFLADRYKQGRLSPRSILNLDFRIGGIFGFYSSEVDDAYDELVKEGIIRDIVPNGGRRVKVPPDIRKRLDFIINRFGRLSTFELEARIRQYLSKD
jgi:hypothetical protein